MKGVYTIVIASLCLLAAGRAQAQERIMPVYAFGFSASFNDSTVYFTDIQTIDSVIINTKTGFILERGIYANQLRDHIMYNCGEANPTCVFFYAVKMKSLAKKFRRMKQKYVQSNKFDVQYIRSDDFAFRQLDLSGYDLDKRAKERKKLKKQRKKDKQSAPQGPGNGPMGSPPGGAMGGPGGMGGRM